MEKMQEKLIEDIATLVTKLTPHSKAELTRQTNLFDSQYLDSFGVIQLISEMEKLFEIQIPTEELTQENFSNLCTLSNLVLKLKARN